MTTQPTGGAGALLDTLTPPPGGFAVGPDIASRARDAVRQVWLRARDGVLARLEQVEEAMTALASGALADPDRELAAREAHRLAGAGGVFGYDEVSRVAREVEDVLATHPAGAPRPEQGRLGPLREKIAELRAALTAEAAGSTRAGDLHALAGAGAGAGDEPPSLLLVHPDADQARQVASAAAARGMRAACVGDAGSALAVLDAQPPTVRQVVLVDLSGGTDGGALALLTALDARRPRPLTLVLAAGDTLTDRVAAARAGARGFLPPSLAPAALADAVAAAAERDAASGGTVLAHTRDAAVVEALEAVFAPAGLRLRAVDNADRLWDALTASSPDLLLLELEQPVVDAIELCRVLRADSRWAALPVVVLTDRADAATVDAVFAAGADDYVPKPVVGRELLVRVTARLERARLYRTLAEIDPLTGLANRRRFGAEITRLRTMRHRYGVPLSVALADIDGFRAVNELHGPAVGDEMLQRLARLMSRSFRAEDVVARWGADEIALGMFGMGRTDGVRRVAAALEEFRHEVFRLPVGTTVRMSFSAAVAEFGPDGENLHEVLRSAERAIQRARSVGGDLVLGAD